MKDPFRIRCFVLVLFMMTTVVRCAPNWSECGNKRELKCLVHSSCFRGETADKFTLLDMGSQMQSTAFSTSCSRYVIVSGVESNKIHMEIRDSNAVKTSGVQLESQLSHLKAFECINNAAKSASLDIIIANTNPTDSTTHCIFDLSIKSPVYPPDGILATVYTTLNPTTPWAVRNLQTVVASKVDSIEILKLEPCKWQHSFFDGKGYEEDEDRFSLDNQGDSRECKDGLLWFSSSASQPWVRQKRFYCKEGTIWRVPETGTDDKLSFEGSRMKCVKLKCGHCTCPFCDATNPLSPVFNAATDGTSCAKLTCSKHMLIESGDSKTVSRAVQDSPTLTCSAESTAENAKWEDTISKKIKEGITNITCVESKKCTVIGPSINSACPEKLKITDEQKCDAANLVDSGAEVCDKPSDTRYMLPERRDDTPLKARSFKCNTSTASWEGYYNVGKDIPIQKNMTVFCITEKVAKKTAEPKTGGITGGALIGMLVGIAFAIGVVAVIVVVFCRKNIKNKRDKVDLKSVSVTGRSKKAKKSKKDKKDKKGKKSSKSSNASNGSKSSEQSMPPEPLPPPVPTAPLPDTTLPPLPLPPPGGAVAAAAAADAAAAAAAAGPGTPVGPDTGKPDRPAVLVDILPSSNAPSEKVKDSKKDAKDQSKQGAVDPTEANTKTGTSFDKSKVEPDPSGGVGDSTKKDDNTQKKAKNAMDESMLSDTGRTKDASKKKDKKDRKVDKKGRGLTDDDEYDIGENAKPVKHEDKNKKEYTPAHIPDTRHINVTADTEDLDPGMLRGVDYGPRKNK